MGKGEEKQCDINGKNLTQSIIWQCDEFDFDFTKVCVLARVIVHVCRSRIKCISSIKRCCTHCTINICRVCWGMNWNKKSERNMIWFRDWMRSSGKGESNRGHTQYQWKQILKIWKLITHIRNIYIFWWSSLLWNTIRMNEWMNEWLTDRIVEWNKQQQGGKYKQVCVCVCVCARVWVHEIDSTSIYNDFI